MMNWRIVHAGPFDVYDGNQKVCQCATLEDAERIVAAMEHRTAVVPSAEFHGCTFSSLELSTRSYNCLSGRWGGGAGIADTDPARKVLSFPNPRRIKNFGPTSFLEVLAALADAKISLGEIQGSAFFQTAPAKWRRMWIAQRGSV